MASTAICESAQEPKGKRLMSDRMAYRWALAGIFFASFLNHSALGLWDNRLIMFGMACITVGSLLKALVVYQKSRQAEMAVREDTCCCISNTRATINH